jgi:hypothetical protein
MQNQTPLPASVQTIKTMDITAQSTFRLLAGAGLICGSLWTLLVTMMMA